MNNTAPSLPRWADVLLLPLVNLLLALAVAAVVVWAVGFSPAQVLVLWLKGAFGTPAGLGYTLYYTTTFIFTGLAVAVAFHGGLFNIGCEGQAMLGGLGATLVALALGPITPAWLTIPVMVLGAGVFGAAWAGLPAAMQAYRGSHVVITTIMFNFLAAALLGYLLVNVLKEPGNMAAESAPFAASARLPGMHQVLQGLGLEWPRTPLNLSFVLALAAAVAVWALLWKHRAGYALRAVGFSPQAALYAGVQPPRLVMLSMALSGALAGLVGVNEIAGVHHRLISDFVAGAGFTGIAVSLIGRNHPAGVVAAALLFGALYQGGAEIAFEITGFSRDMVFMLQGLIVLFAGAMAHVAAAPLAQLLTKLGLAGQAKSTTSAATAAGGSEAAHG